MILDIFQDKKILVILGLIGLYTFYMLFLRENSNSNNALEAEYENVLNSDKHKVKGQWD